MCFRCFDDESDSSFSGGSDTANDDEDDANEGGKNYLRNYFFSFVGGIVATICRNVWGIFKPFNGVFT